MKILIADDDFTTRTLLAGLLPKWGLEAVCAADGLEAQAIMSQADPPRLAILDWMMPGLDGLELCRELRRRDQASPVYVILLTSKSDLQDIVKALEEGADDYVTKPFDSDELRARIRVGQRIIALEDQLREQERLQGVLQMSRAVCHELNQPLQVVLGYSQLLLMDIPDGDPKRAMLIAIQKGADRLAQVTRQVMNITHSQTKEYLGNPGRIADLAPRPASSSIH